jgi:hypothetical protein
VLKRGVVSAMTLRDMFASDIEAGNIILFFLKFLTNPEIVGH